jgi:hypothetical protein
MNITSKNWLKMSCASMERQQQQQQNRFLVAGDLHDMA